MERFMAALEQLRLWRLLSVLLVGTLLFLTTACNNGDIRGARPENPPVQMGGNNNPHSMGGDGYTNYKASTDPKVNQSGNQRRSDASLNPGSLIASSVAEGQPADLLYPGSQSIVERKSSVRSSGDVHSPNQIPVPRQEVIDRSDPDEGIMESIGKQFREASDFLKQDVDSATEKAILNEKAKTDSINGRDTVMEKSY